jgi:hypothetical protein
MSEIFSAATLTAIKNAGPPFYAAVLIGSGLILFLPADLISQIGLAEFRDSYRTYLGALFIGSACLVSVHSIFGLAPIVGRKLKMWSFSRTTRGYLKTLTKDEKEFLRPYIIDGQNTRNESIYNGIANGLEGKGLIYKASMVTIPGSPGMRLPFNMQPYVRRLLTKHRHWLE